MCIKHFSKLGKPQVTGTRDLKKSQAYPPAFGAEVGKLHKEYLQSVVTDADEDSEGSELANADTESDPDWDREARLDTIMGGLEENGDSEKLRHLLSTFTAQHAAVVRACTC